MKRGFKRFAGMLCSCAFAFCSLGALMPLSASATTIYGDVDNSGYVDVSKVMVIPTEVQDLL